MQGRTSKNFKSLGLSFKKYQGANWDLLLYSYAVNIFHLFHVPFMELAV